VQRLVAASAARQHHVAAGAAVGDVPDEPGIEMRHVAGDREDRRVGTLGKPRVDARQRPHPLEQVGHLRQGRNWYWSGLLVTRITSGKISLSSRKMLSMKRPPLCGRSALLLPIRLEAPPARITPVTPEIFPLVGVTESPAGWV